MREDAYEEVLFRYPELIEPGMRRQDRQKRASKYGARLDLLLVDCQGRRVIAELKRGIVHPEQAEDIVAQLSKYKVAYRPDRLMLVAPRIHPEVQQVVQAAGFEVRELPETTVFDYVARVDPALFQRLQELESLPFIRMERDPDEYRRPEVIRRFLARVRDLLRREGRLAPDRTWRYEIFGSAMRKVMLRVSCYEEGEGCYYLRAKWDPGKQRRDLWAVGFGDYDQRNGRVSGFWRRYLADVLPEVEPRLPGRNPDIRDWKGLGVYFALPYERLSEPSLVDEAARRLQTFIEVMLPYTDAGVQQLRRMLGDGPHDSTSKRPLTDCQVARVNSPGGVRPFGDEIA